MKKTIFFLLLFAGLVSKAQNNLNIVPTPAEVKMGTGTFTIDKNTVIVLEGSGLEKNAAFLNDYLQNSIGYKLKATKDYAGNNAIRFNYERMDHNIPGAYNLTVDDKGVYIAGDNAAGVFYGIQTLVQMLAVSGNGSQQIPQLTINDRPRFEYRGMHLDVCRHFSSIAFVKKYIDYLAAYKYNVFHWHLTEDQGWRIEIKKYPELTGIGAWRNGTIIGRYPGTGSDNLRYGGFYTQAEIREVVAYAAAKYIDVIPEIEMPGHSSAAIAAYPWLSCFPAKPTEIPARMISQKSIDEQKNGRIKLVQETWGVFDDVFCAGKDSTFTFLQNVIDEVLPLFPSKYFHIGGDESPKTHWIKCPACQKRIKELKLKDEHELQSWFVQRIEKYLNKKGKILIGWDEILEGGLAPNAVVMSWRGEKGGIEAAKQKHKVIMTPGNPLYFDHTQSKNEDSVTIGGYNPIENVYAYEPISKELTAEEGKYILGAQANMWREYMKNDRKTEYMMFPRMTAFSEVLWSPKEKRNWKDYERRLPSIYERLEGQGINYSKAYYDLKATVLPTQNNQGILFQLTSKLSEPIFINGGDTIFPYEKPLLINNSLTINATLNNNKSSVWQSFSFNKATGKKITLTTPASQKYPGDGAFTLVNAVQNQKGMSKTTEFLGFLGDDMEAIIDLGKETEFKTITVNTLTHTGSWIYPPKSFNLLTSNDGINFTQAEDLAVSVEPLQGRKTRMSNFKEGSYKARYIKVIAKNYGIIPADKPGAGTPAWMFVDEIEVE
ncbi:MAG TPA: family 20 glycosylhydrolase [Ferruginibacter sp.]|nr:family 20 glycosylhydrolase [Ferruginibacter sp.]